MGIFKLLYFCMTIFHNMKKTLLLIAIALIAEFAIAQTDTSSMNRLGLLESTETDLIVRCRDLIAEALLSNNKQELLRLTEYACAMQPYETKTSVKFYGMLDYEKWLIYFYLHKFGDIATDLKAYDTQTEKLGQNRHTYYSMFIPIIYDSIYANNDEIIKAIENDNTLTQEDKDALSLFVLHIKNKVSPNYALRQNIEKKYFIFFEKYPNSWYSYFLSHEIYFISKKDEKKFSLDFGLGYGLSVSPKDLDEWFGTYHGGADIDIAIGFMKCEIDARVHVTVAKPRQDIYHDESIWEENERSTGNIYQFTFGRRMQLGKGFVFIPRIGIGNTFFATPDIYDDNNSSKMIRNVKDIDTKWMPVLAADIRYEKTFTFNNIRNDNIINYFAPTLRYSFQPIKTTINGKNVKGSIHSITAVLKIGYGYKKG